MLFTKTNIIPQNPDKEQLIWEFLTQPMKVQIAGLLRTVTISMQQIKSILIGWGKPMILPVPTGCPKNAC